MNILVTGANGFVGKNLIAALRNIRDGKDKTHPGLTVEEIFAYDITSTPMELDDACAKADFVFNLAGVNRPQTPEEFMQGNFGFANTLLETLKKHGNKCPVMLASSIQAKLEGRFANSEYGRSKKAGEDLFIAYHNETGANVLIYQFPNLFGKWCKPNYNSVVATFCNNIACDLPIQVNDPNVELDLAYIDDVVEELLNALQGHQHHDGHYCCVPVVHHVRLGEIADLLYKFKEQPSTLIMPELADNSFAKKLYSTYLSYLPKDKVAFPLTMHEDARGSFTELLKTLNCGQVSVNISKPGITKGQHWHNSKWEFFIVVAGHGLIQERKIGTDEILEFEVSGDNIQAVHMLPGYTHNIINLSDKENLVTVMWANELFNPDKPDTFAEDVENGKLQK